jgi:hypothetical protein
VHVRTDDRERIPRGELAKLLELQGVEPQEWMHALEGKIGGMHWGESYFAVHLGFRNAFRTYFRTNAVAELPRTKDGRVLLRVGVRGDTLYFVSESGEAWIQDGIEDRFATRFAESFDQLATKLEWPVETRE